MADEKIEFPVTLTHPKTKGKTTAATKSSLRVLESRGWQREAPKKASSSGPSS